MDPLARVRVRICSPSGMDVDRDDFGRNGLGFIVGFLCGTNKGPGIATGLPAKNRLEELQTLLQRVTVYFVNHNPSLTSFYSLLAG